jgi:hypothetical protein
MTLLVRGLQFAPTDPNVVGSELAVADTKCRPGAADAH